MNVWHWDPLKTVPGSGFVRTWKINEKTIGKTKVSDGPKQLKNIEKKTFSWWKKCKKRCQRGPQSHVFSYKMVTWASQVRLILWFLTFWCDAKKSSFLDAFPMDRQIQKIRAVERQRVEKTPSSIPQRQVSGRQGSPGPIESRTLWQLDHPQGIPTRRWAEGPANMNMNVWRYMTPSPV